METPRFQWRWFWLALLAFAAVWLLVRLRTVLLPFLLAAAVAYLLNPLVDRLQAQGVSRNRSIVLILVFSLVFVAFLGYLIVPRLAAEITNAADNYDRLVHRADTLYRDTLTWVQARFPWVNTRRLVPGTLGAQLSDYGKKLLARTPTILSRVLQSVLGFIFLLLLTAVLTFWMLKEYHAIGRRLLAFVPRHHASTAVSLSRQINHLVSAYLGGQLILAAIAAIVVTIILLAFRVKYAIVIGLLSGALYLIPYFGVPAAIVISVIVSAVTGHSWAAIAGIVGCFVVLNVVMDYIVSPRLIGTRVHLHPLTILFAMVAAGELFGFLGVLIAVPLAAATKAVLVAFFPEFFAARPEPAPAGSPAEPGV
jgi:predicted PurR-regulated permease PerM